MIRLKFIFFFRKLQLKTKCKEYLFDSKGVKLTEALPSITMVALTIPKLAER